MIIIYWCPTCRSTHCFDELSFPDEAGAPILCLKSSGVIQLRGLRDDPDDPLYGTPRCPVCEFELRTPVAQCPECGAQCS
jgi:hypothetical protein